MRGLAILLALALPGCEPGNDHADERSAAAPAGGAPSTWDSDMPKSTPWTPPAVSRGQTYWRLVEGYYYGPGDSAAVGGCHHIFFQARDLDGTLLANQMAAMLTGGADPVYALTKDAVDQGWLVFQKTVAPKC
jgi:hypothetical protein